MRTREGRERRARSGSEEKRTAVHFLSLKLHQQKTPSPGSKTRRPSMEPLLSSPGFDFLFPRLSRPPCAFLPRWGVFDLSLSHITVRTLLARTPFRRYPPIAWRSGVGLCRGATRRGISRSMVRRGASGPGESQPPGPPSPPSDTGVMPQKPNLRHSPPLAVQPSTSPAESSPIPTLQSSLV
jgi:hypothetical protein